MVILQQSKPIKDAHRSRSLREGCYRPAPLALLLELRRLRFPLLFGAGRVLERLLQSVGERLREWLLLLPFASQF